MRENTQKSIDKLLGLIYLAKSVVQIQPRKSNCGFIIKSNEQVENKTLKYSNYSMVRQINKCENKFNKEGTIILVSAENYKILWEIEDHLNKGGIHHIMNSYQNSSMLFLFSLEVDKTILKFI